MQLKPQLVGLVVAALVPACVDADLDGPDLGSEQSDIVNGTSIRRRGCAPAR